MLRKNKNTENSPKLDPETASAEEYLELFKGVGRRERKLRIDKAGKNIANAYRLLNGEGYIVHDKEPLRINLVQDDEGKTRFNVTEDKNCFAVITPVQKMQSLVKEHRKLSDPYYDVVPDILAEVYEVEFPGARGASKIKVDAMHSEEGYRYEVSVDGDGQYGQYLITAGMAKKPIDTELMGLVYQVSSAEIEDRPIWVA